MKLGFIDYLNAFPFYYRLFEEKPAGIELIGGYPSFLNGALADAKLDMTPISAAAYPDNQESFLLLPDFSLSSLGYVHSVILSSNLPIEELDGKKVGLTTASKTSRILLKILLKKYYNLEVEYTPSEPLPNLQKLDAALVIGNEAMKKSRVPAPYTYDLADLWQRKTGHPVVFAVFAVRKDFARTQRQEIEQVIAYYRRSLKSLKTDGPALISAASARYPDLDYDISEYFDLLTFNFSADLKKALLFYYQEAAELGFLPPVTGIEWW